MARKVGVIANLKDRDPKPERTLAFRKVDKIRRHFASVTILGILFLAAAGSVDESPATAIQRARHAQSLVGELADGLSIDSKVYLAAVAYDPFVFSVEPTDVTRGSFRLSMELGFLQILDDEELRAALAHELGHVWIFTHHPFLQTERLANEIGMRITSRSSLEKVYRKLWSYEGSSGMALEELLGPKRSP